MKRPFAPHVLVAAAVLATGCGPYNRLVALQEQVESAWSQVQNVYQRRADLVPNLVETVKGAASFERETLEAVVAARSRVGQVTFPQAPTAAELQAFERAQGELSSALSRLLAVVEAYPELGATQAFRDLQSQLEGTENRIAVERRRFNEAVQAYNTARRQFPAVLIAKMFGFEEKAYFAASPGAEQAPSVQF